MKKRTPRNQSAERAKPAPGTRDAKRVAAAEPTDVVGFLAGSLTSYGDVISPLDERWEASGLPCSED
jgi:hypothetical protein